MTVEGFNRLVAGESFLTVGDATAAARGATPRWPPARRLSVNNAHQYLSKTAAAAPEL